MFSATHLLKIGLLTLSCTLILHMLSQSRRDGQQEAVDSLIETKLDSKVHIWSELPVESKKTGERRHILKGSTTHLHAFEIHATTLDPNLAPHPGHVHENQEEMVIVKEGDLEVTIEGKKDTLGPGSIALILPRDFHAFHNASGKSTTYYVLKYTSKYPMNLERGQQAGGSFVVHWEELAFREHGKGGRRDFFDRPTAMADDFEMHVTNLNENTESHPPHTHDVEEIILMIKGDISMHIDGKTHAATTGDLVFLDSQVPHAPTNIGEGQCIYFAFQWK